MTSVGKEEVYPFLQMNFCPGCPANFTLAAGRLRLHAKTEMFIDQKIVVHSLCEDYGSALRMRGGGACCGVSGVYGAGATLRFRDDTPFGLPLQPRCASTTQRPTDFA